MSTKKEVNRRRREMAGLIFKGDDPQNAAIKLAQKYDVQETTIISDWSRRKEWLGKIFELDDPEIIIMDLLAEMKEIKTALWKIVNNTKSDSVKLGALKQVWNTNKKFLEIMQSIGKVNKAPQVFQHTGANYEAIKFENIDETRNLLIDKIVQYAEEAD